MTGSPELVAAVRTTKQFLTYVASGPFQYAIAEALALPDAYYTAFRDGLRAKRDLLDAGLRDAGFTAPRSASPSANARTSSARQPTVSTRRSTAEHDAGGAGGGQPPGELVQKLVVQIRVGDGLR